jgi:biopolymer transport protein ExbB/TolQ
MQISQQFVDFAAFTAEIVFYVLMSLNIASLAIIAERATFFWRRRIDADLLTRQVLYFLKQKDLARARAVLARLPAPECAVLLAGLVEAERGTEAAGEAMRSAQMRERIRMQTNLTMLKAVAFAAPTLGALGTLLGLVGVMPHLSLPLVNAQGLVGTAVREALGALAIASAGLMVGIPAAVASLLFSRRIQLTDERCGVLTHLTLALVSQIYPTGQPAVDAAVGAADTAVEASKSESPAAAEAARSSSTSTNSTLMSSTLFVSPPALRPETLAAAKKQDQPASGRRAGKAA